MNTCISYIQLVYTEVVGCAVLGLASCLGFASCLGLLSLDDLFAGSFAACFFVSFLGLILTTISGGL